MQRTAYRGAIAIAIAIAKAIAITIASGSPANSFWRNSAWRSSILFRTIIEICLKCYHWVRYGLGGELTSLNSVWVDDGALVNSLWTHFLCGLVVWQPIVVWYPIRETC